MIWDINWDCVICGKELNPDKGEDVVPRDMKEDCYCKACAKRCLIRYSKCKKYYVYDTHGEMVNGKWVCLQCLGEVDFDGSL